MRVEIELEIAGMHETLVDDRARLDVLVRWLLRIVHLHIKYGGTLTLDNPHALNNRTEEKTR